MIARMWRGTARSEAAADYVHHLERDVFPELRRIAGFQDAWVLRREEDAGVEFVVVTRWESLEAIHSFAGQDLETAVVAPEARAALHDWDPFVRHFEIVAVC